MDKPALIDRLVALAKTINNLDLIELTNNLRLEVATIKGTLADTIEENRRLKAELQKSKANVSTVTFRDGLYFKGEDDGPYCTACYDSKKQFIRVTPMGATFAVFGRFRCPNCHAHFQ